MKPEEQRIAIAKAHLGYEDFDWLVWWDEETIPFWTGRKLHGASGDNEWEPVLDYLNDLNAMHEAEKTLKNLDLYRKFLYLIVLEDLLNTSNEPAWATAAQRAEAFIRTIGKWNSDKINKTLE
jgi:hypothetical protein